MASEAKISALAEEWLDDRQAGRGLAANTEAAYRRDLVGVAWRIAELTGKPPPDGEAMDSDDDRKRPASGLAELDRLSLADLTRDNLRLALASLNREGYAPATRNRILSGVRGFTGWLVDEGHLASDPTRKLVPAKEPDLLPVAFLGSELEAIARAIREPDPQAKDPWPARDRALLAIMAGAGLRAAEVIGLGVADVRRDEDVALRVLGKGNKERRLPVGPEVVAEVDAYLAERSGRLGSPKPDDPLLVRSDGRPLSRSALDYLVRRWLLRAGVRKPDGESAHAFRHTYAKGLLARGVPVTTVQQLLGHANIATTQRYLRMTAVEMHEASRAAEILEILRHLAT